MRAKVQSAWYWICRQGCAFWVILCFGFRALHADRVPRRGGVLLVSNHQSYLDPMLAGVCLSRQLSFMARRTLFRNPVFGWILRSVNAFEINRDGVDTGAFREAVKRLTEGKMVVIYPEGTRTRDGSLQAFKGGMELLAKRAGVAVLPMVVDGAFEAWPRNGAIRLRRVWAAYGRPIGPDEIAAMDRGELTARVEDEMRRLLAELRSRRAGPGPAGREGPRR
ncbi:MAG TPA: lysophospholipid acyltransferase family protein [Candidatus Brocadiia bacterium]|nr:lysophospholipid acyltransferase family protein [Candidatus Brocadiia bacterium]